MSDNLKPQIFLFLSVDIIGSTNLKYNNQKTLRDWFNIFSNFYTSFPEDFSAHLEEEFLYKKIKYDKDILKVWKYAGDEILMYIEITKTDEVPTIITAYKKTLEEWFINDTKLKDKLKVKGSVWIGQTPFIDRKINDKDDFIGPSIDCGFRLGKYSSQYEIAISVEVADLCNNNEFLQTSLFYKKSENLKGVLGDNLYPIFVITLKPSTELKEYKHILKHCDKNDLDNYISLFYKELEKDFSTIVSRIDKDIEKYLLRKEDISKKIIYASMKNQEDLNEVSDTKKQDNTEEYNNLENELQNFN